jgi:hypothetical protein
MTKYIRNQPDEFEFYKTTLFDKETYFYVFKGLQYFYSEFIFGDEWLKFKRPIVKDVDKGGEEITVECLGKMVDIDDRVFAFVVYDRSPMIKWRRWRVIELTTRRALCRGAWSEEAAIAKAKELLAKADDEMLAVSMKQHRWTGGEV